MYQHCRPRRRLFQTALNWEAPRDSCGREGHPVRPQFLTRGRGLPTPDILCRSSTLCPHMPHHQPNRRLLPVLLTLHLSLLLLPVGRSLSHHPSPVRHLQLGPRRLAWAVDHADCLPGISLQDQPIEQAAKGTKCTLDPSWVQRCNHAIVCV